MSLKLHIADFDNAAFEDDWRGEVARILLSTAQRIINGADEGVLIDTNGNTVGEFEIDPPVQLIDYVVTYYAEGDEDMDNQLEFKCEAEDEDHAERLCEEAHPGCTTTAVDEVE